MYPASGLPLPSHHRRRPAECSRPPHSPRHHGPNKVSVHFCDAFVPFFGKPVSFHRIRSTSTHFARIGHTVLYYSSNFLNCRVERCSGTVGTIAFTPIPQCLLPSNGCLSCFWSSVPCLPLPSWSEVGRSYPPMWNQLTDGRSFDP
jgi:hypothetical protein